MNRWLIRALFFSLMVFEFGCAGPVPVEDYVLARAALDSAREHGAEAKSPGLWSEAEQSYKKAQRYFKDHENYKAKDEFVRARQLAEKAENTTRLKKMMSGETF